MHKHVYDLTIFGKRYAEIKRAAPLIELYNQIKDENNDITATKPQLQDAFFFKFGVIIKRRTINDWVKALEDNNVIKYKTNGEARLNPYFCYDGKAEDYEKTIKEWLSFKTAVKNNVDTFKGKCIDKK